KLWDYRRRVQLICCWANDSADTILRKKHTLSSLRGFVVLPENCKSFCDRGLKRSTTTSIVRCYELQRSGSTVETNTKYCIGSGVNGSSCIPRFGWNRVICMETRTRTLFCANTCERLF